MKKTLMNIARNLENINQVKRDKARNLMEFVTVQEAVYYAYVNSGAYGAADVLLTEIYGDEAKPFLIN